jgi:hypothetical protein
MCTAGAAGSLQRIQVRDEFADLHRDASLLSCRELHKARRPCDGAVVILVVLALTVGCQAAPAPQGLVTLADARKVWAADDAAITEQFASAGHDSHWLDAVEGGPLRAADDYDIRNPAFKYPQYLTNSRLLTQIVPRQTSYPVYFLDIYVEPKLLPGPPDYHGIDLFMKPSAGATWLQDMAIDFNSAVGQDGRVHEAPIPSFATSDGYARLLTPSDQRLRLSVDPATFANQLAEDNRAVLQGIKPSHIYGNYLTADFQDAVANATPLASYETLSVVPTVWATIAISDGSALSIITLDEVFSYSFSPPGVQLADHTPMGYSVSPGAYKAAAVEFVRMFAIVIPARGSGARPDAPAEVFARETGVTAVPA